MKTQTLHPDGKRKIEEKNHVTNIVSRSIHQCVNHNDLSLMVHLFSFIVDYQFHGMAHATVQGYKNTKIGR